MANVPLPSIPTDNLYKFMAIAGLAFAMLTAYLSVTLLDKAADEEFAIRERVIARGDWRVALSQADVVAKFTGGGRGLPMEPELQKELLDAVRKMSEDSVKSAYTLDKDRLRHLYDDVKRYGYFLVALTAISLFWSWRGFRLWYQRSQVHYDLMLSEECRRVLAASSERAEKDGPHGGA